MKNKILASVILTTLTLGAGVALANTSTGITNLTGSKKEQKFTQLTAEQKVQFEEIKSIMEKKKSGVILTEDEEAKIKKVKSKYNKKGGDKMGEKGNKMKMGFSSFQNLTDAEKLSLEKMSDTEKKAFFEAKRLENETKAEAREVVIDKLIAGATLNDAEKKVLEEIKIHRSEMKAKKAEMKELKSIMEKKKSGTVLTSEEETKLETLKNNSNKNYKFDKR